MKKVNVYSSSPLAIYTPAIAGTIIGEDMKTGDILQCIHQGARVEEVLENGTYVPLTYLNYNMDNSDLGEVESQVIKPVVVIEVESPTVGIVPEPIVGEDTSGLNLNQEPEAAIVADEPKVEEAAVVEEPKAEEAAVVEPKTEAVQPSKNNKGIK